MAYVEPNYPTKKALKEAVKAGTEVSVFQPGGIFPLTVPANGRVSVEGPHYPQPHRWYAVVEVDDNNIVTRVVQ